MEFFKGSMFRGFLIRRGRRGVSLHGGWMQGEAGSSYCPTPGTPPSTGSRLPTNSRLPDWYGLSKLRPSYLAPAHTGQRSSESLTPNRTHRILRFPYDCRSYSSIIKPDAVAKNHIGAIYDRFERAGLRIVAARVLQLTREQASAFYLCGLPRTSLFRGAGQLHDLRT